MYTYIYIHHLIVVNWTFASPHFPDRLRPNLEVACPRALLWPAMMMVLIFHYAPEVLTAGSPEIFSPFIKGDSELGRVSSIQSIPSERRYFFQFLSSKSVDFPSTKSTFDAVSAVFGQIFLWILSDFLLEEWGPPPNNSHPWYRFENNHPSKWLVKWVSSPSYKWGMLGLEPIY